MSKKTEISFILPIRNEEPFIEKTIESIIKQNSNVEFEIIIADGRSTDYTKEIIEKLKFKHDNIILIDNPKKIVSTGFNLGLNKSKGNVIIRLDGHSKIASDFLSNIIRLFDEIDVECIGGPTKHISSGITGISISIAQTQKFGVGNALFRQEIKKGEYVDTLAFGAYKRKVFRDIGGYDEELVRNQDDEFSLRLQQNGGKIWLDPSIKSYYYPRVSLLKLFKQYFQYGFFKIRVFQKRRALASIRQIIPFLFVIYLILTTLMWVINIKYLFLICSPLIIYFSTGLLVALNSFFKRRRDFLSILILPITFFTLHLSYGLGFLIGLVYFVNKWSDVKTKDYHFRQSKFV